MNSPESSTVDDQKAYEARLQRRLGILRSEFEAGKVKIAEGLPVLESLEKIRFFDDGTADLSTVDGHVRSMALAVEMFHDREEAKNAISLSEIQNLYFKLIEQNFGGFFAVAKERGMTAHDAGKAASSSKASTAEIASIIPQFLGFLSEFWSNLGEAAWIHVEDMREPLKGVYGGDLFPAHNENIASKCGLYTDTIILPDPFLRCQTLFKLWPDETKVYYFMKHVVNILQYRELACTALNVPIVVVLPDRSALEREEMGFVAELGRKDTVPHAQRVFGRSFNSFDEVMDFTSRLKSADQLINAISDQERVLFDVDWEGTFREKLERAFRNQHTKILGTESPGHIVALTTAGRMGASNELLIKAQRLHGTPIIDAPTSWKWFCWKLEYDAERVQQNNSLESLHVVRGLQSLASSDMEWLGRIPPEALIEIRTVGALDEIRQILGRGVKELSESKPFGFHRSADKIFDNIDAAFNDHRKRIAELTSKKWKFAGSDIGSWLVVGSLGVVAAATGQPVWGLAALAADQVLDAPRLHEIPQSIRNLAKDSRDLRKSPVGLLFKCSQNK